MNRQEKLQELKTLFKRRINSRIRRLSKRIENINANLKLYEKREEYILKGELLKINLGKIKKGVDSVVITNCFSPEQNEINIKLDPKLSPVENMKNYFKIVHKMKKGLEIESERLEKAEKEVAFLNTALENFMLVEDLEIADEIFRKHFGEPVEKKIVEKRLEKRVGKRYPYNGGIYIVGRKDSENDELVKKIAHGNDWWFHIRDYTGSHVILILPKGTELDGDFISTGALIALINSKAKNSPKEEVIYTQVKNLKKIPGKPGLFSYSNVKSVLAVHNEEKIRKLEEFREFHGDTGKKG
ncbi:MAG TPA: DUF814 domain-containing protein [Firmicutes bacterium]|nr:DUF814 domain-containing protein [Bacillota bacterium]